MKRLTRLKTKNKPKWPLKEPVVMPKKLQNILYPEKQRPRVAWLKRIMTQAAKTGVVTEYKFVKAKI